ncbi:DegT/DnrJ/EryC1/StrS family aminotransferase [Sulfidibacter corallicola]|uniref:DegT/DnrJ/EryC1/StrS family aminotransferase n=1 Tax=Sulfidibacter corallicola TaxID=2818388 RepID=A0A8A4TTL8_SULCO|nr:DegT/DnrJ/EryC1/StrS family aminotransferase [Sulfidibacter corallicola]QTD53309.1 DegT/DnrJ/EryC1/StrS family aminotransferase [Sulfidibacter corallicola]
MADRIFLSPPHMGGDEAVLVQEAFASNYIAPVGPMLTAFEEGFAAYVGIPHCVALASCTAATHLVLRELGVGPGDEVIGSSLTFIGSISPVTFVGARVVLIDCDRSSWNMDLDLLAEELERAARRGKLPKAVIPTDLYGQCIDMDRILEICAPYEIPVISDAAEALGACYKGRHAGQGAYASVYSFNGNKIITTSGGGMLASEDAELVRRARYLSTQARQPAPHYEHTEIGYNYRLSNICAAIGRGQLRVLDERVTRKREIFEIYRERLGNLPGIQFMPESPSTRANRWLTVILVDPAAFGANREDLRLALEAENIESRPVWKPMHLQPVFHGARAIGGAVSQELFERGLCLPSGTALTTVDLDRICTIIRSQCPSVVA